MRKTLIFGNGLGMALDPHHFYLPNALQNIWNSDALDPAHRQLISACLPHQLGNCPQGEDDLDKLHVAISSCEYLSEIPQINNLHWLSQYGWDFPSVCRSFITQVATCLYDYNNTLPEGFGAPLADFIRATKSHVATLNYDKLLYELFINNNIVNGFNGSLVDGITNAGFNSEYLERKWGNNFGYYLHLHGSPLFKNRNGVIKKLPRFELNPQQPEPSSHIVLTHIRHKPAVISSSEILSSYWQHLYFSLSESSEAVLFGYSGLDKHLNELLSIFSQRLQFKVVEWAGSGNHQQREEFWRGALRQNVNLIHKEDILNFQQW
jgi:hypothetical protein